MNRVVRAEHFYQTIILASRNSKTSATSKTEQLDSTKSDSFIKSFFGGKSHSCILDNKTRSSPSHTNNTNEAMKKYEQDLQLAYYSELQEFANTLFKKGTWLSKTSIVSH